LKETMRILTIFKSYSVTTRTESERAGALYVNVVSAVKVNVVGTTALGSVSVFMVPEGAVRRVPVPEELGVNGSVNTTEFSLVAVLTTCQYEREKRERRRLRKWEWAHLQEVLSSGSVASNAPLDGRACTVGS
jgi:hypothetical protein